MLVDYRCVDVDRGMVFSYIGKLMVLSEVCFYVGKEIFKEWVEFSRFF